MQNATTTGNIKEKDNHSVSYKNLNKNNVNSP